MGSSIDHMWKKDRESLAGMQEGEVVDGDGYGMGIGSRRRYRSRENAVMRADWGIIWCRMGGLVRGWERGCVWGRREGNGIRA
jgi:hypothetical protein